MAERQNGRMEEWQNGRMAERQNGRMEWPFSATVLTSLQTLSSRGQMGHATVWRCGRRSSAHGTDTNSRSQTTYWLYIATATSSVQAKSQFTIYLDVYIIYSSRTQQSPWVSSVGWWKIKYQYILAVTVSYSGTAMAPIQLSAHFPGTVLKLDPAVFNSSATSSPASDSTLW